MIPFVLRGATKVEPDPGPSVHHFYDRDLQIWVDRRTGVPVVLSFDDVGPTRYGETTLTETREGTDQTEITSLNVSNYGETSMTKTFEGVDQTEGVKVAGSRYGETSVTATAEGADKPEASGAWTLDIYAPYSHF